MDEGVDQVIEEKYGSAGIFTDPTLISRAYKNPTDAETHLKLENRHPPEAIRYTKDICNYIYETYGRFSAHIDAFYTPGFWVQVHHLELDYYLRFFDPYLWRNQAAHNPIGITLDEHSQHWPSHIFTTKKRRPDQAARVLAISGQICSDAP